MKMSSPLRHKRARIEIIPLIDIMFFLLAAFMLASANLLRLQSVQVHLPAAETARQDFSPDILNFGVDQAGQYYIGKTQVQLMTLSGFVSNQFQLHSNSLVYITADAGAKHAAVTRVLETVYAAGVRKVSFTIAARYSPEPNP